MRPRRHPRGERRDGGQPRVHRTGNAVRDGVLHPGRFRRGRRADPGLHGRGETLPAEPEIPRGRGRPFARRLDDPGDEGIPRPAPAGAGGGDRDARPRRSDRGRDDRGDARSARRAPGEGGTPRPQAPPPAVSVALPIPVFPGRILAVTLPAGPGGAPVTVGGQNALPLLPEGEHPNAPAVGMEVRTRTMERPPALAGTIGPFAGDPAAMARKCAGDWGARFLFLSLAGCHPDGGGQSVLEGAAIVREVLSATPVPVIVGGCGDEEG